MRLLDATVSAWQADARDYVVRAAKPTIASICTQLGAARGILAHLARRQDAVARTAGSLHKRIECLHLVYP